MFFPIIFFFSNIRKKKRKTVEKNKNVEKGKELSFKLPLWPCVFVSTLSPSIFFF
jgi:hypothetical protein